MKVLVVLTLSLVAVAKSRPDAAHLLPSGSYLPAGSGGFASGHGSYDGSNQVQDHKHVYFFAGPDDQQYTKFKIHITPASHKNTKIIFVKAPSHGGVIPEVIAPPSALEDKTLVYVLVKKPQDGSITIPAGVGVNHAKPEVFFIKYNNKHDAATLVNGGVQGQRVGSNVPELGNEAAFVGSLDSGSSSGTGGYVYGNQGGVGHANGHTDVNILGDGGKYGPPGPSGPY